MILYTVDVDAVLLYSGLASGVRGYVLKVAPMAELVGAIERIAGGGSYVDPRVDGILLSPSAMSQVRQLSPHEREVMRLMAEGPPGDEIARRSLRDRVEAALAPLSPMINR